jgi:xylan 1,4-beta-xylosidase
VRLLSWAFLFVGERCFEGTRAFSTQGIDKAILNLFRLYAKMGSQAVGFESNGVKDPLSYADVCGRGEVADISGFATLSDTSLAILIYHQHDNWDAAGEAEIALEVEKLAFPDEVYVTHYRIDGEHSNAYTEWVRQGKPIYPTAEQRAAIKARDGLEMLSPPQKVMLNGGNISLNFRLPVHGVSLVIVSTRQ